MGEITGISWTHHTFNTWWGCVKVSPACRGCYAEAWAKRAGHDVWGQEARRRFFGEKHWNEPFKWNAAAVKAGERRRVFCSSMADVFEQLPDGHPDELLMDAERLRLFRHTIPETPQLDWLILTKRPDAMARYLEDLRVLAALPRNVVAMTTAENQEWFDKRIGHLLATPALRRGLSLEPLLGEIDLWPWLALQSCRDCARTQPEQDMRQCVYCGSTALHAAISWVIVGGESGPDARPMHPEWAYSLRDQCVKAKVPFHLKQWGEWVDYESVGAHGWESAKPAGDGTKRGVLIDAPPGLAGRVYETRYPWPREAASRFGTCGPCMVRVGKKAAGRLLDGREWSEFPEVTHAT